MCYNIIYIHLNIVHMEVSVKCMKQSFCFYSVNLNASSGYHLVQTSSFSIEKSERNITLCRRINC